MNDFILLDNNDNEEIVDDFLLLDNNVEIIDDSNTKIDSVSSEDFLGVGFEERQLKNSFHNGCIDYDLSNQAIDQFFNKNAI